MKIKTAALLIITLLLTTFSGMSCFRNEDIVEQAHQMTDGMMEEVLEDTLEQLNTTNSTVPTPTEGTIPIQYEKMPETFYISVICNNNGLDLRWYYRQWDDVYRIDFFNPDGSHFLSVGQLDNEFNFGFQTRLTDTGEEIVDLSKMALDDSFFIQLGFEDGLPKHPFTFTPHPFYEPLRWICTDDEVTNTVIYILDRVAEDDPDARLVFNNEMNLFKNNTYIYKDRSIFFNIVDFSLDPGSIEDHTIPEKIDSWNEMPYIFRRPHFDF